MFQKSAADNSLKPTDLPRFTTPAVKQLWLRSMTDSPEAMPLPWVARFAPLIGPAGGVLDLACGEGRHVRYLAARDHPVTAIDRNRDTLDSLKDFPGVEIIVADLEGDAEWPVNDRLFAGIIVTNYLHRPLMPKIVAALAPGGVLIYQTFAVGNERYGRPRNPLFLLNPGELLDAVAGDCQVIAYECGMISTPNPAVIQRICAVKSARQTVDAEPLPLPPG